MKEQNRFPLWRVHMCHVFGPEPQHKKWSSEDLDECYCEMRAELQQGFTEAGEQPYSLAEALKTYQMVPTPFWSERFLEE